MRLAKSSVSSDSAAPAAGDIVGFQPLGSYVRWHCVQLTAADISRGWHSTILGQFETHFIAMASPSGMAMFATDFSGGSASLYFSAATARYAPGFMILIGALACYAPSEPVALLAGDPTSHNQIAPR
jgi:hypothetical protein